MAKSAAAVTTAAPGIETSPGSFQLIPIAKLVESPSNHRRKSWGDLDELAASIASKGVLVPICVRPAPAGLVEGAFEIVYGHRRFRAATKAGLAEMPALVRHLNDIEVIEAQVIENADREDVHPLEEAEGLEQLLAPRGPYSVDDIAAKLGKSRGTIYARLKLLDLTKESREAFYEGKVSPSTALYLARVPAELQPAALQAITPRWRDADAGPMPAREASRILQQEFMHDLAAAPFALDDAELVPAAGACTTCPKRTGAQADLFADVEGANVCTAPDCYREKVDAVWARKKAAAEAGGARVLSEKEARAAFDGRYLRYGGEFVEPDSHCERDPKQRSYAKLLGKRAAEAIVLARDADGNVRQLLPKKEIPKLLKAAGHDFKAQREASSGQSKEERAKWKAEQARREATDQEIRRAFAAGCAKEPTREVWDLLLEAAMDSMCGDEMPVLAAFGYGDGDEERAYDAFKAVRAGLSLKDLRAITIAMFLDSDIGAHDSADARTLFAWAGVDAKAARERAKKASETVLTWAAEPKRKNVWLGKGCGRAYEITIERKGFSIKTLKPGGSSVGSWGHLSPIGGLPEAKAMCEEDARRTAATAKASGGQDEAEECGACGIMTNKPSEGCEESNHPEIIRWVAGSGGRIPSWVTELTGLKTDAQLVTKFGEGATIERGRGLPDPNATAKKKGAKGGRRG